MGKGENAMIHNVLTLNNGIEIPQLGLGTWFIRDDIVADAIKEAVNIGYRHFDTAQAYGNERGVGEGIRNCGIPIKWYIYNHQIDKAIIIQLAKNMNDAQIVDLIYTLYRSRDNWQNIRGIGSKKNLYRYKNDNRIKEILKGLL